MNEIELQFTKYLVNQFLAQFQQNVKEGKNRFVKRRSEKIDCLKNLGWLPSTLFEHLAENLTYGNWLSGPMKDHNGTTGDIWEFGIIISDTEYYVKFKDINGTKCLSFHEPRKECFYRLEGI